MNYYFSDFYVQILPFGGFLPQKDDSENEISVEDEQLEDFTITYEEYEEKPLDVNYTGGGKQITSTEGIINPKIRLVLEKLAFGSSTKKIQGNAKLDVNLMLKYYYNMQRHKIPTAKYDYDTNKVYIFIDTSGSVANFAKMIITIIISCIKSSKIVVISGSEALPNKNENTGKMLPYAEGNLYCARSKYFHQDMKKFIKYAKPQLNSRFIFWGDLRGTNILKEETRLVLKGYNCLWLNPNKEGDIFSDENKCKYLMKYKNNINTVEAFIRAII